MGMFREQHALLTVFKWFGMVPFVPPVPKVSASRRRRRQQCYLLRIAVMLLLLAVVMHLRLNIVKGAVQYFKSITYVVWTLALLIDVLTLVALLVGNGLNVGHYGRFAVLLDRVENTTEMWMGNSHRSSSFEAPYGRLCVLYLLLCVSYHVFSFLNHFVYQMELMLLQIRWEVLLTDLFVGYVVFVLCALGRCAERLGHMCRDALRRNAISELCVVLRLQDDLLRCVELVNRLYGVLFLCISASWLVAITCLIYFDFLIRDLRFDPNQPFLVAHVVMLMWNSVITGGLIAIAGSVAQRIKDITRVTPFCTDNAPPNRRMAKMIDKMLIKRQFMDVRFTVYELFTIDNRLSYTVLSSIVTYLVILTQFRELEQGTEDTY